MIKKEMWKKFERLGISKDLVCEQACGIWFKNIGASLCISDEQKKRLIALNTQIQSKRSLKGKQ